MKERIPHALTTLTYPWLLRSLAQSGIAMNHRGLLAHGDQLQVIFAPLLVQYVNIQ